MIRLLSKYRTIAGVGLLLCTVRLLLRWRSLPQVLDLLNRGAEAGCRDISTLELRIYYVDRWLERFPYNTKGNCFPRALALYWLTRRAGRPVRFCCGIRREGSNLDGHAWLTLDQEPFHELSEQWRQYTVTFSYPELAAGQDETKKRPSPEGSARVA
ncbi:MAG: lasso peptide biosynthesis B2 protein [Nitrospira sp.]|nr:lasso peptide biosynthesis B2 protein [Nitrospira sp.]